MPTSFYGKDLTYIGSIGSQEKKKTSRITSIKCKSGNGGKGGGVGDQREIYFIPLKNYKNRLCIELVKIELFQDF